MYRRCVKKLAAGAFFGAAEAQWRTGLATLTSLRHDAARIVPEHAHERAFLTLLLAGRYRERVGGHEIDYSILDLVFHPEGLVHSDEIGAGGARFFTVELAPEAFRHLGRDGTRLVGTRDVSGGALVWRALSLLWLCLAAPTDGLAIEEGIADLLERLRENAGRRASAASWLARVDDVLRARFREGVSLSDLAATAGVHPVHLSQAYRRARGCTLSRAVQRLRVREACRLIEGGAALSEAAQGAGFVDHSHLTAVFRRLSGSTPSAVRRLLRAPVP